MDGSSMSSSSTHQQQQPQVPPGFRFHPTDEELVDYYLRKKVAARRIDLNVIKDVDLYKIEPWDLQERCRINGGGAAEEEQNEWYFFSHKDKKYPTGTRTNRATAAGFWKATGRDKPIYASKQHMSQLLVGMRKTLVYYRGRAPNGHKSNWIMHEYRLETSETAPPQEEGWVVCRVFKKRLPTTRRDSEHDAPCSWYVDEDAPPAAFMSPMMISTSRSMRPHHGGGITLQEQHIQMLNNNTYYKHRDQLSNKIQQQLQQVPAGHHHHLLNTMPHELEISASFHSLLVSPDHHQINMHHAQADQVLDDMHAVDQVTTTDWRVLDKFVASQLSNDATNKGADYADEGDILQVNDKQEVAAADYASTSTSSSQIDPWK